MEAVHGRQSCHRSDLRSPMVNRGVVKVRPGSQYRDAIELMSAGMNAAEVSRALSVPPRTAREWSASPRHLG
jgi:hypothetical protein